MDSTEIAKIAGVSRSTVSRVVNNYPNVSKETRKKVLKVIEEYDYAPHASARILAGVKNRILGLFIIDITERTGSMKDRITKSPYYLEFISLVIGYASEKGYKVLVHIIHNPKGYKEIKECFYNETISGGIFIGENNNDEVIKKIINDGYKVVLVDQEVSKDNDYKKCIVVNADNFKGAYDATKYLIDNNHTKIAHITGDIEKFSTIERIQGYKKALEDANIPIKDDFIVKSKFLEESGYTSTKKLLSQEDKPTAIFAGNDKIAIGAMNAIKEMNLKIPDDICIIGFDDIEECKYINPPLTTIRMDLIKMAEIATDSIIAYIEQGENVCDNYTVNIDLIERESCTKLK